MKIDVSTGKTVLADGTAEQTVIREMKARAAGARGDIEQIVRGVMADVQERGWDAVVEYAEKFDGKAPYIVEPSVLDAAYNACDPKLISALEKAAANIRDYHEQMLVKAGSGSARQARPSVRPCADFRASAFMCRAARRHIPRAY